MNIILYLVIKKERKGMLLNEVNYLADIETERTHQGIFQRLVSFDKSEMKHADTQERIVLPSKAGGGA